MFAFIFVYAPAKFRNDGPEAIKSFQLEPEGRPAYVQAALVLGSGLEGVLERGIYATAMERDVEPQFSALDPTRAKLDYDIVIAREKDPWPSIIAVAGEQVERDVLDRSQRIRETFPGVQDSDLKEFFISRSASIQT